MPFAVSTPILYYNQIAFTKAGLNPNSPPATLTQMVADATALKAWVRHGPGLDSWHLETWFATANQLFVNNKNGRSARATAAVFNNKTSVSIFTRSTRWFAPVRRNQPWPRAPTTMTTCSASGTASTP